MSEEIANASTNVPRSMLVSILLNGVLGFSMLIAVLFCIGDIEGIIETPTGYPFIAIFVQATQSVGGSTGMATVIVILGICATIAFVASASRMTWSFARDHGLPFWYYLSKVSQALPGITSTIRHPPQTLLTWNIDMLMTVSLVGTGRTPKFNPSRLDSHHRHDILPPRSHQHRLLHRLQRRHLPDHQRSVRFLLPRLRFAPSSPNRRLHLPPQLRNEPKDRHRRR